MVLTILYGSTRITDLAEIDRMFRSAPRPRGRPTWRATDELTRPGEAAVRRAAFYIKIIKRADEGSRTGRHERAIAQALQYMKQKGYLLPDRESLETFLKRPKRRAKPSN